jgi:signal transduction histidine kinase/ActR/RegA family two-component response regulator
VAGGAGAQRARPQLSETAGGPGHAARAAELPSPAAYNEVRAVKRTKASPASSWDCLAGGGEMGALMRRLDWAATPLGAPATWPASLRGAVTLLLASNHPMYVAWGENLMQFYNDAYREILGPCHPHALGRSARETFSETWDVFGPLFERVMSGGPANPEEDRRLEHEQDGQVAERHFTLYYSALSREDGNAGGVLVTALETTRHREEAARREQISRLEAEAANRAKDEFLAVVSHELRTPLGAILIWTQLLRQQSVDEATVTRALGIIERSTKTLAQLLDDLLDVSRIVSGKIRLEPRPVDLPSVLQVAVEAAQPAAEQKGLSLEPALERPLIPVSGDPVRLQQVVSNLLSNAIKFTPAGGRIDVRLDRVASQARIQVTDTGIGIRPDFLPYIFEHFRQADSTSTRENRGLGLGLAISRHLVQLHGGTIEAESAGEGQGASFTIMLPLMEGAVAALLLAEADQTATTASLQQDGLVGVRVLVVDDAEDAREALSMLLGQFGALVTAVGSADEALSVLEREQPHVLLSDIAMPDEDGYTLIRKVRALEAARGGRVPAAALTAYATPEDRMKALHAGYHDHLPKPVDPAVLIETVLSLARRGGAPPPRQR